MNKLGPPGRVLSTVAMLIVHGAVADRAAASVQETAPIRIRVFVECNGTACDDEHLRTEITYVDWVRDRLDAQVELLVTRGETAGGGERYDLAYLGRGAFDGVDETLQYVWIPTATDAEARDGLTRTLAVGLLRYVARTPTLQRIAITYDEEAQIPELSPDRGDPWKGWVFRTGFAASFVGEDRSDVTSISGGQSVSRVTNSFKVAVDFSGEYSRSHFETSDTTTVNSVTQAYAAEVLLVGSLGEHWGLGARVSAERSTFRNYDLSLRIAPAAEFNIYPYSESTRRQLRVLYAVGPQLLDYTEETVYLETTELRFQEALTVSLDMNEPWGSAILAVEASHLLDEFAQNRLESYGFLEVQLLRGLGVFVEGSVARVRDQINIPRGDATEAEVLLRQRELLTDFRLEGRVGFNLTFGSIFSDVVNARFGS